jgi:hypothetical protein
MTDPISFTSASPRFALPFLFAAQAQKEFFVNEALARIDGLLHPAIVGETNTPPTAPQDGQSWIVGSAPVGAWAGQAGKLACRQSGNWLFAAPANGMRVHDTATGQQLLFEGTWQRAAPVTAPTGGTTVDTQARAAIAGLISALVAAGILA